MIKYIKLLISYTSAYFVNGPQSNKNLHNRLILMHSWVKLHQDQVNNANKLKNAAIKELERHKKEHNYANKLASRYSTSKIIQYKAIRQSNIDFWKHLRQF